MTQSTNVNIMVLCYVCKFLILFLCMGKKEKICIFKVSRLTHYNPYNLFINTGQAVFILPEERTTGLGCIPDGTTVNYECTVMDRAMNPIGTTVWLGSAFGCSSSSNSITLLHARYTSGTNATCGDLSATSVGVVDTNYTSRLTVTANTGLDGTMISCTISNVQLEGSDTIKVGGW